VSGKKPPPVGTDDLVVVQDYLGNWGGPFPVGRVQGDSFWVWTTLYPLPMGAYFQFSKPDLWRLHWKAPQW
jgi:hypothetical protein